MTLRYVTLRYVTLRVRTIIFTCCTVVLFRMKGTAHAYEPLSLGFNSNKIKQELIDLGDDLNCDINLIDDDIDM
jgi:hypothetical protein